MKPHNLKLGDRVIVTGYGWEPVGQDFCIPATHRWTATITMIKDPMVVALPDIPSFKEERISLEVYPCQCRRLIKKQRRVFWVRLNSHDNQMLAEGYACRSRIHNNKPGEWFRVREWPEDK